MKYLAAYALCALSGSAPTKDSVKAVLKAGGVAIDEARINELFSNFEGKEFSKVMQEGLAKVNSCGGGVAAAAAPAASAAAPAAKGAAPAGKKKAPTPPPSDDDDAMIGGLF